MDRPAGPVHVNVRPTSTEVAHQRVADGLEQKSMQYSQQKKSSLWARYVYGIIFLIINLKAWFFRDYSLKVLMLLNCEFIVFPIFALQQQCLIFQNNVLVVKSVPENRDLLSKDAFYHEA